MRPCSVSLFASARVGWLGSKGARNLDVKPCKREIKERGLGPWSLAVSLRNR